MAFCPFSHRVHLLLAAKQIPHHKIYVDLIEKPEWYKDYSPLGKVPALQLTGIEDEPTLVESLIIAEYLDQQYPQPRLFPTDPLQKALDKILIERFAPVVSAIYPVLTCNPNAPADAIEKFENSLDVFEVELAKRGTPYFAGQTIGIVDYMIWPWFERLSVIEYRLPEEYNFDEKRFPKITKWIADLKADSVVKSFIATPEQHNEFWRTRKAGNPNYDLLA